jgi:2-(1,2-epoxy-1,2-dihydrophenyl)acetyl-CoA isomerase
MEKQQQQPNNKNNNNDTASLTITPDGIAILTLNRPEALNALNTALVSRMRQHIKSIANNDNVRVLVITGSGRGFCSGAEMKPSEQKLTDPSGKKLSAGQSVGQSMRDTYNPLMDELYHLKKPIIVSVNGICAGGGVGLALIGDIVIAGESASFVQVFAPKLGLVPDLGSSWMAVRLVGRAQAMGLAMLGDVVKAKDAERLGLIWKCVPDSELQSTALGIAQRLASGPTQAFASLRPLLDKSWSNTYMQQMDLECEIQEVLGGQSDYAIGVKAFRTKTKPVFTGRASSKL